MFYDYDTPCLSNVTLGSGNGKHPAADPWKRPFDEDYYPDRMRKAGSLLSGPFTYALDGVQGDADFIAAIYNLKRTMSTF